MSARSRTLSTAARGLALVLGLLLGCGGANDHEDGHEEGPAHVIPAHRPTSFPEGVKKLQAYQAELSAKLAQGRAEGLSDLTALTEALDVAKWLPEVAAESDMPEEPWNEVDRRAGEVAAAYEGLLGQVKGGARTAADPTSWLKDAGLGIKELEATLSRSRPDWFADAQAVVAKD